MPKPLPPLNAVRAFEIASRHLNLSRAAEELGVTQSAISKQVSALEDHIGVQLFTREPGGLRLTAEGAALRDSLRPAFALMQDAFSRFHRRAPRSMSLRIATLPSFASQFLAPRLEAFRERFPEMEIEIHASTRVVDLTREEVDIAIRHGIGGWDGVISTALTPGRLVGACSPEVYTRFGGDTARLLHGLRRIQTMTNNEWRDFAVANDVSLPAEPAPFAMEDFLVALRLSLIGQGLVLLPDLLLHHHFERGELKPFCAPVPYEQTFHIVHTAVGLRRPGVPEAIDWLKSEAAAAGQA